MSLRRAPLLAAAVLAAACNQAARTSPPDSGAPAPVQTTNGSAPNATADGAGVISSATPNAVSEADEQILTTLDELERAGSALDRGITGSDDQAAVTAALIVGDLVDDELGWWDVQPADVTNDPTLRTYHDRLEQLSGMLANVQSGADLPDGIMDAIRSILALRAELEGSG